MLTIVYSLCFLLFLIGLYCVLIKRNLIKIAIGIALIEYAINLFIVLIGYKWGSHAPVISQQAGWTYADPLIQAIAILSILVGLVTLLVFSAISLRLWEKYRTFDVAEIRKLKG